MASTYQMPVDVVCEDGFVPEYKHDGDAGAELSESDRGADGYGSTGLS